MKKIDKQKIELTDYIDRQLGHEEQRCVEC
jgi:hypothetical protein